MWPSVPLDYSRCKQEQSDDLIRAVTTDHAYYIIAYQQSLCAAVLMLDGVGGRHHSVVSGVHGGTHWQRVCLVGQSVGVFTAF